MKFSDEDFKKIFDEEMKKHDDQMKKHDDQMATAKEWLTKEEYFLLLRKLEN